jgi:hypothetical protein
MAGKAGLKAGLIGAAALIVISLINQFLLLPISQAMTWVGCGLSFVGYLVTGVLAGYFLAPPRAAGKGASAGAIAGLIGGGLSSIVGVIILVARMSSGMGIPGASPEQMQQLTEMGMDPTVLVAISGGCGFLGGLGIGAGLGAVGGAIFAAVKPD